jgi:hypothetical protein
MLEAGCIVAEGGNAIAGQEGRGLREAERLCGGRAYHSVLLA